MTVIAGTPSARSRQWMSASESEADIGGKPERRLVARSRSSSRVDLLRPLLRVSICVSMLLVAATAPAEAAGLVLALEPVVSELTRPVVIAHAGDDSGRLFIAEQGGRIRIVKNGTLLATPFLDISALVEDSGNEQGLLGLAFHPDFWRPDDEGNGFFYVNYTEPEPEPPVDCPPFPALCNANTVVARYQVSAGDPDVADPTGQVLFKVNQPRTNHNGGNLAFGPDGLLYVGLGDGGGGGDPYRLAQDLGTLHGSILRLDVDGSPPPEPNDLCGLEAAYGVPASNPFVGEAGACDEIWSYGLRNPWRFSFDRVTGDLFIGDVGQRTTEEIDFQSASSIGGENYGWSCYEGSEPYPGGPTCAGPLVFPILEYPHEDPLDPDNTGRAVTGGYRYRGALLPRLHSVYLYADFSEGRVWGTVPRCDGVWESRRLLDTTFSISTFGEDTNGEILIADLAGGSVYRVGLAPESGGPLLEVQPTTVEFGAVEIGRVGAREIVITNANTGPEALIVSELVLSDTGLFELDPFAGSTPCETTTPCLSPGESCTVSVAFAPTSESAIDETLTGSGNSPEAIVQLAATAVACAPSGVRTLPATTVSDARLEEACETLAAGLYEIAAGGDVTFRAGRAIRLGDGFKIGTNGRFVAILDPN